MTKAVLLTLGLLVLAAFPGTASAQTSAADLAVNRAILNQANTIMLRQKLEDAKTAATRGDLAGASALYEDAFKLVLEIGGSGIDAETAQTVSGLTSTLIELAKQAQAKGNFKRADEKVMRALKVDPQNPAALAFKHQNDQLAASMTGRMPDQATIEATQEIVKDKAQAATHVQNGKLLYETGRYSDAEVELALALKFDPDSYAASYYLNLCREASVGRAEHDRAVDSQKSIVQVEKEWAPKGGIPDYESVLNLPKFGNPYAQTNFIHTSDKREEIYHKLDIIQLDKTPDEWANGIPLSEIIRYLIAESKARDPEEDRHQLPVQSKRRSSPQRSHSSRRNPRKRSRRSRWRSRRRWW